jgi:hypothetical protein
VLPKPTSVFTPNTLSKTSLKISSDSASASEEASDANSSWAVSALVSFLQEPNTIRDIKTRVAKRVGLRISFIILIL